MHTDLHGMLEEGRCCLEVEVVRTSQEIDLEVSTACYGDSFLCCFYLHNKYQVTASAV
jgi:hypothetical protein